MPPPAPVPKLDARPRADDLRVPGRSSLPLPRAGHGPRNGADSPWADRWDGRGSHSERVPPTEAAGEVDEEPRPTPDEDEPRAQDLLRRYLREIGRVALLTAAQEVELGQRIERGQERMRRAILAVPM